MEHPKSKVRRLEDPAATRASASASATAVFTGDTLPCVLSFCGLIELLSTLPCVNRAFRHCLATVPRAWPSFLDFSWISVDARGSETLRTRPPPWQAVNAVRLGDSSPLLAIAHTLGAGLAYLDISWSDVSTAPSRGALLSMLERCRMRRLVLCGSLWLQDDTLASLLARCPDLIALDVKRSEGVTNDGLRAVGRLCPSLEELDVSCVPAVSDAGVAAVAAGCPRLRALKAESDAGISDAAITAVATHCPNLQELNVSGCAATDTGICAIARHCCSLRVLNMEGCRSLTDACLLELSSHCPDLEILSADDGQLTDTGLRAIARNCNKLVDLQLGSSAITGAAIDELARSECAARLRRLRLESDGVEHVAGTFPRLKELHILDCPNLADTTRLCAPMLESLFVDGRALSDASFERLGSQCPALEYLDISSAPLATDASVTALARGCSRLRMINLHACEHLTWRAVEALVIGSIHLREVLLDSELHQSLPPRLHRLAARRGIDLGFLMRDIDIGGDEEENE
jgi:hypothetical protein